MTNNKHLEEEKVELKATVLENKFFFDKYGNKFVLAGEFKTREEANKHRQEIREAGFISRERILSPNKHERPYTIWKGRKKKNMSEGQKIRYSEKDDQGRAVKHGRYGKKVSEATLKKKSDSMKKRTF